MSFGPIDSAIRVAAIWSVSTAIVVWYSADFATRKPRDIPIVLGLLVAFASNLSMLAALLAPYPVFLALYPERRVSIAVSALFIMCGFALVWANSILLQLFQNVGYRIVGIREQPIRWYRRYKPKARRRQRDTKVDSPTAE